MTPKEAKKLKKICGDFFEIATRHRSTCLICVFAFAVFFRCRNRILTLWILSGSSIRANFPRTFKIAAEQKFIACGTDEMSESEVADITENPAKVNSYRFAELARKSVWRRGPARTLSNLKRDCSAMHSLSEINRFNYLKVITSSGISFAFTVNQKVLRRCISEDFTGCGSENAAPTSGSGRTENGVIGCPGKTSY